MDYFKETFCINGRIWDSFDLYNFIDFDVYITLDENVLFFIEGILKSGVTQTFI